MIIVRLMGGLGNQMFQYAAGRRLSVLKDVPLKLDISYYNFDKLRNYQLDNFNIDASFASEDEILILKKEENTPDIGIIEKILKKMGINNSNYNTSYFREKSFNYDKNIVKLPADVYLDGYWQSEKYFSDIRDIIRQEFSFKDNLIKCTEISQRIKSTSSVSLHIRRGDYVTNSNTNSYHGLCSLDYYYKAVEYIAEKVEDPHFYIFSDDAEWVKENLIINYPMTIISNLYSKTDIEDLRLMSMCKNHIIANSSFSWWGAWLSNNPEKIVCTPSRWFRKRGINTCDLVPEEWHKIK